MSFHVIGPLLCCGLLAIAATSSAFAQAAKSAPLGPNKTGTVVVNPVNDPPSARKLPATAPGPCKGAACGPQQKLPVAKQR